MNIISGGWKALAALAANLSALADTVGETNSRLRERLGLDRAARVVPALSDKTADGAKTGKGKGKAGDGGPATIPLPGARERRKQPTP